MSKRIEKINELLRQQVGKITLKETDIASNILLTISKVSTSPDLKKATVYITALPQVKELEVLKELEINKYNIQKALNRSMYISHIPKLEFKIDKQMHAEQKVYDLLAKDKQ